jgi:uncharacterized membrane-anchored protein YhcB (DUF1043 family)
MVLLGSTVGGLLAMTLSDWWVTTLVGVVLGVVVGVVLVLIWANQSL